MLLTENEQFKHLSAPLLRKSTILPKITLFYNIIQKLNPLILLSITLPYMIYGEHRVSFPPKLKANTINLLFCLSLNDAQSQR